MRGKRLERSSTHWPWNYLSGSVKPWSAATKATEPPVMRSPTPKAGLGGTANGRQMCGRENCETAWKHVRKPTRAVPASMAMTIDERSRTTCVGDNLAKHSVSTAWRREPTSRQPVQEGRDTLSRYPSRTAAVRKLGDTNCVVDRSGPAQAVLKEVLQAQLETRRFIRTQLRVSARGRSAHQAVAQARERILLSGYGDRG